VNVQLSDAATGGSIWSGRFETTRGDLFEVQDQIVGQIAQALDLQLIEAETRRTFRERPDNPDARDLAVRGWSIMNNGGFLPQTCLQCADLFERALAIEHQNVRAMIGLSLAEARLRWGGWSEEDGTTHAEELVEAALRLEPQNTHAHFVKAMINARLKQQFELGLYHFHKAIALNRNYANALVNVGFTKRFMGMPAECLPDLEKAFRLSPRDPQLGQWYRYYGSCLLDLHRYEQAIEWLYVALRADPSVEFVYRYLISALAHVGRMTDAHEHLAAYLKVRPVASIRADRQIFDRMFHPSAAHAVDHLFDGLRKAGLPE
jgi:tetratricopeptide (TPR) repeat protein